uniref:Adenosine deaminase domain-containing protein n=1 Tax=Strigamia maritima TaxID=126957 RepID=T1JFS2_STRMM
MDVNANFFCKSMPKVELHAHLSGSFSKETCQRLLQKYNKENPTEKLSLGNYGNCRSLDDANQTIGLCHKLTNSLESIYTSTCDVIKEYAADNVKYLELRSRPRALAGKFTRRQYIEAILAAVDACVQEGVDIDVKYLLSIDRAEDISVAQESIQLARELLLSHHSIVGMDLSGNPKTGDARVFIPLLQEGRKVGLKLAFHAAEFPGKNPETKALIEMRPDRLGQAVYVEPEMGGTLELTSMVENYKIPIEYSLTANMRTGAVPSIGAHPFWHWYSKNHPCILTCDGKGIMNTSLTNEFLLAARSFQLSSTQVWDLSQKAINYIFADDETKAKLHSKWRMWQAHEAPSFTNFLDQD